MSGLFAYLKRVAREKREYKQMQERAKALPEAYSYVYQKIQNYMFGNAGGDGMDLLLIFADLLELFETGAAEGRHVLEITGEDVAAFCDELLRNAMTYTENRRKALNRDVMNKLGKGNGSK